MRYLRILASEAACVMLEVDLHSVLSVTLIQEGEAAWLACPCQNWSSTWLTWGELVCAPVLGVFVRSSLLFALPCFQQDFGLVGGVGWFLSTSCLGGWLLLLGTQFPLLLFCASSVFLGIVVSIGCYFLWPVSSFQSSWSFSGAVVVVCPVFFGLGRPCILVIAVAVHTALFQVLLWPFRRHHSLGDLVILFLRDRMFWAGMPFPSLFFFCLPSLGCCSFGDCLLLFSVSLFSLLPLIGWFCLFFIVWFREV